jgi:long-chain acyl-CoA synthetase
MVDFLNDVIARYLIIHPFITFIGWIDTFVGLFKNRKFVDNELPDKDAVLSALTDPTDPTSAYRSTLVSELITVSDNDVNLFSEFQKAVHLFAETKTLGTRELLSIDDEVQKSGKIFKKFSLGSYKWLTYEECQTRTENLSNGLLKLGLKSNDNIVLFSETKAEWLLSAFACFRIKVPIVTLYSTLGIEALAFGINETKSEFVIISGEQLPKIQKILDKIPNVKNLIVLTNKFTVGTVSDMRKKFPNVSIHTMQQVEELGRNTEKLPFITPKRDDLAIIMYTSGSTGNPKGVMMSHINLVTSLKGLIRRLGKVNVPNDIYIAFLPLAHVLELCCEVGCFINGVRIGYSSAQTIADTSTAIKAGEKGDLRVLKPTIMAGVPIVLGNNTFISLYISELFF